MIATNAMTSAVRRSRRTRWLVGATIGLGVVMDAGRLVPLPWLSWSLVGLFGGLLGMTLYRLRVVDGSRPFRILATLTLTALALAGYHRASRMRIAAITEIDDMLGEMSYCSSLVVGPLLSGASSVLPKPLVAYGRIANDVCRVVTFSRMMSDQPGRLCPGASTPWPRDCAEPAILRLSEEAGLTLAGQMLLVATVPVAASHEGKRLVATEQTKGEGAYQASLYVFDLTLRLSDRARAAANPDEIPAADEVRARLTEIFGKALTEVFHQLEGQVAQLESRSGGLPDIRRAELDERRARLASRFSGTGL